jgi:hypothetical protein
MNFNKLIGQVALSFMQAWIKKDFNVMMSFFANDIIFESSLIAKIYLKNDQTKLFGPSDVIEYFKTVSIISPSYDYDIDNAQFIKKEKVIHMHLVCKLTQKQINLKYQLNEYGKFKYLSIESLG